MVINYLGRPTSYKGILRYETETFEENYLGLLSDGCKKKGRFKATKEKFRK
jgi:hypothetical protein